MVIITFLIVLSILVFVHELGHFLIAKATGMRVDEFAIGFPPKIFSKKIGETVYSINLFPLGGFVKIYGENPDDSNNNSTTEKEIGFLDKPKLSRLSVLFAGVLFNFLFAWLCFAVIFMSGFSAPQGFLGVQGDSKTTITSLYEKGPASIAGIQPGDEIIQAQSQGETLSSINADGVIEFIANHQNSEITFILNRDGENLSISATPVDGIVNDKKALGVSFSDLIKVSLPIHKAIYQGYLTSVEVSQTTAVAMFHFFGDLFTGKKGVLNEVSGPVGIATMVGQASEIGFSSLVMFVALISINLAVLNLIPFPALDGGQILFVIIEWIIRRPIKPRIISILNISGFALLITLMIIVTIADIFKFF